VPSLGGFNECAKYRMRWKKSNVLGKTARFLRTTATDRAPERRLGGDGGASDSAGGGEELDGGHTLLGKPVLIGTKKRNSNRKIHRGR